MPHMIKHPAEILRKEFMIPLGLGATALAAALHVSERRVRSVLQAQGPISVDTAMRLARYFGTTPGFWLNMFFGGGLPVRDFAVWDRINFEVQPWWFDR